MYKAGCGLRVSSIIMKKIKLDRKLISNLEGRRMFVGLGAMKSGTSWLSVYLKSHPDVFQSPVKEMNFFNTLVPNSDINIGQGLRFFKMKQVLLQNGWRGLFRLQRYKKMRDLIILGHLNGNTDAYLQYFASRIGEEKLFGEICTSYACLPPEGYQRIAELGYDLRMFFIMRDPTDRAISHIQHHRRRHSNLNVDDEIERMRIGYNLYDRSNYTETIRSVSKGAPNTPFETFIYEDLFTEKTMMSFCDFLGIKYIDPDFSKEVNVARTPGVNEKQAIRIREKLEPVYRDLEKFFGNGKPKSWKW